MAISPTDICNQAILKTGDKGVIGRIGEDSDNGRLCTIFYGSVRDAVLRSHPWNCASHQTTITALATGPVMNYEHQYQLPANPWCLRILQVGTNEDQPTRWKVFGRRLYTDESSPPIEYIKRITDTNEFDPLLVDALVLKLAIKLAMPLTSNPAVLKGLIDELEFVSLPEARSVDGQEGSVEQVQATSWTDARF